MSIIKGLHLITDTIGQQRFTHLQLARQALSAGVKVIQYRQKNASTRSMVEEAGQLVAICNQYGAKLIVNDRMDVALAAGAHGVHLGQSDLPLPVARRYMGLKAILGASVDNLQQLQTAHEQKADYVGYGPIFKTDSKQDASSIKGLDMLAEFVKQAKALAMPVIALGGVGPRNIAALRRTETDGVAVIGAICRAENPEEAARELLAAWQGKPPL